MNTRELASAVAAESGVSVGDVQKVLKGCATVKARTLAEGGEVTIAGEGRLYTQQRTARQARNPRTGEMVEVPAKVMVRFKPGKDLNDAVNPATA